MLLGKFKTHGAVFDALKPYFKEASTEARASFGTAAFFTQQEVAIHRAFDRFCAEHGLSAGDSALLRDVVKDTSARYPHMATEAIRILSQSCPRQFSVRGTWTSPRASVTVDLSMH